MRDYIEERAVEIADYIIENSATVRQTAKQFRISKSKLKLNQIAELTGYSDPKYMSRVFKEEVGMLPTEFRKKMQ